MRERVREWVRERVNERAIERFRECEGSLDREIDMEKKKRESSGGCKGFHWNERQKEDQKVKKRTRKR